MKGAFLLSRSILFSYCLVSLLETRQNYVHAAVAQFPSWDELDARPLPGWYDQAKFGIFIHWGVFSVPSYGSEWFWCYWKDMHPDVFGKFVNDTERPGFTYQEYASRFTAKLYRPDEWADAFAKSGAQYVVLTSKHHEGFCKFA